MKKLIVTLLCLAMVGSVYGCGNSEKPQNTGTAESTNEDTSVEKEELPVYDVIIATHLSKESVVVQGFEKMAELMNEKTNGRFTYTLSDSGQLGSQRDIMEACNLGSVQFCVGEAGLLSSYVPVYGTFALPFLFDNAEHYQKCAEGEVGQSLIAELENKTSLTVLGSASCGFRSVFLQKPVNSLADLKGVKIRTPESSIYVDTFTSLGANPTAVPASEMYSAIQTGVVDGMENVNETIVNYKIYEVVTNCSLTKHIHNDQLIVASKTFVDSMAEEDKALLKECAKEAALWITEAAAKVDGDYRAELEAAGIIYNEVNLDEFRQAVTASYDNQISTVPEAAGVIEAVDSLR